MDKYLKITKREKNMKITNLLGVFFALACASSSAFASLITFAGVTFDTNNGPTLAVVGGTTSIFGAGAADTFGDNYLTVGSMVLGSQYLNDNTNGTQAFSAGLGNAKEVGSVTLKFGETFTFYNFTVFENGSLDPSGPFAEVFTAQLRLNDGTLTDRIYLGADSFEMYAPLVNQPAVTAGASATTFSAADFNIDSTTLVSEIIIQNLRYSEANSFSVPNSFGAGEFDPDITYVVLNTTVTDVPEPRALLMFTTALIGLFGSASIRRRKASLNT